MELIVFGILILFGTSSAQIIQDGQCNQTIPTFTRFRINDFLGTWNVIETLATESPQATCARFDWSNNVVPGTYDVSNTHVEAQTLAQVFSGTTNDAIIPRMLLTIPGEPPTTMPYWILATNYNTYALAYSCSNIDENQRRVSSWKLSRSGVLREIDNNLINNIMSVVLAPEGITPDQYKEVSQTNSACFYLPEIDGNEPVVFRGQCEDITRMKDFNLGQYIGWWHQIESYATIEEGDCRSSRYTSSANQVQVVDTIVNNNNTAQHVTYTVTATANGQLIRKSEDSEETWVVLGTDYENYALLYKCENINSSSRRIWSAKHSKTGLLTEASQQTMASIIAEIPELHPPFYGKDKQDNDACFYYPVAIPGHPVILRGQCDRNIPVVTNFETSRFNGSWYNTEKYPEEWDVGGCAGVNYTENRNEDIIDVREWHVVDNELDVIEGFLTQLESNNNAARFISTLPSRRPEENPQETSTVTFFDILRTDYESFAVTYSCVDVNPFERRIHVWKLSRTRSIPDAVVSDINNLFASREELDQRYFDNIEQNDDDCLSASFLVKSSIIVILVSGIFQLIL